MFAARLPSVKAAPENKRKMRTRYFGAGRIRNKTNSMISGRVRSMKWRLPLVLILLSGLAVLAPLAYASPPDPAWIGGIYDDDDFDNVVLAATSAKSLKCPPSVVAPPLLIVVEVVRLDDLASPSPLILPAFQVRAPPSSEPRRRGMTVRVVRH